MSMSELNDRDQEKLDAAVMRRLITHLDARKDVQNIDLMILADFCRNCLGKWYKQAADEHGLDMSDAEARERIYGMPYEAWKEKYQKPATGQQMKRFEARNK